MTILEVSDSQWYEFSQSSGLELGTVLVTSKETKDKYKHIANFRPHVQERINKINGDKKIPCVRLVLEFKDGETSAPFVVPLKDLDKVDWSNEVDLRCLLNPDLPKANEHIGYIVRSACYEAHEKQMTAIERLGTHIVESVPVFNAGNQLIWPVGCENKPEVSWKPDPYTRLVVDPNCSEREAYAGMERIIALSTESGRIIFSLNLLSVQREVFIAAGINPRCSAFNHGTTGFKKTTYAGLQTQLYNRDKPLVPPPRLNASEAAAVKLLYEKSDCVVVLDDLFPADSKSTRRKQEEVLIEITRVIGDGIPPARVRGKEVAKAPPRCGVLFTGEYYIGSGSDAARLFPVKVTTPIDNDKLTACQNEPLMLSTFYRYYIEWYITSFDAIRGLLKEWVAAYRSTKTGMHDRLQETQFCFEAAYKLYLTYCLEKGFISQEDSQTLYLSFYTQLRAIVKEQNALSKQAKGGSLQRADYFSLIRSMYRTNQLSLVDCPKRFKKHEHDGVIHGSQLYLRKDRLLSKLKTIVPSVDFDEVLDDLKDHQALKMGRRDSSRQLHGITVFVNGVRRPSNLRFYVIKLAKLY